jgi:hypothetical protein
MLSLPHEVQYIKVTFKYHPTSCSPLQKCNIKSIYQKATNKFNTYEVVGSVYKPIGAMDAPWQGAMYA